MVEILASIVGAGVGALLLRLVQHFWLTKKEKNDTLIELVKVLETHIKNMGVRVDSIQKELDDYREKYFKLKGEYTDLKDKYFSMKAEFTKMKGEQCK